MLNDKFIAYVAPPLAMASFLTVGLSLSQLSLSPKETKIMACFAQAIDGLTDVKTAPLSQPIQIGPANRYFRIIVGNLSVDYKLAGTSLEKHTARMVRKPDDAYKNPRGSVLRDYEEQKDWGRLRTIMTQTIRCSNYTA